jgi:hypothetical protein
MRPDRVLGQASLNERDSFRNLIEAVKVAETACRQLAYLRSQPQWFLAQNAFEALRDTVVKLEREPFRRLEHKWLS